MNRDPKECLKLSVGLVPSSCPCIEEGRPADYATSLSGLYIANQEFGLPIEKLQALKFNDDENVWTFLEKCREDAISTFLTDLNKNIPDAHKIYANKYSGFVGNIKEYSYTVANLKARIGEVLVPKKWMGLKAQIKGVRIFIPGLTDGTIDVHLSTDLLKGDTTPHYQLPFTGNTGDVLHVDVPANLPLIIDLHDQYNERVEIFFSVLRAGNDPLNTKFHCSTCNTLPAWSKFFSPKQINVDTLDELVTIANDSPISNFAAPICSTILMR